MKDEKEALVQGKQKTAAAIAEIKVTLEATLKTLSDSLRMQEKDEKKLKKEGYKQEDIAKILDGAPKSDFKPEKKEKKDEKEEDNGGNDGGNPLAGL